MCCSDWVRHRVGPGSDGIRAWESGSILRRLRDTLELASGFVREEDDSISAMDRKGKSTAETARGYKISDWKRREFGIHQNQIIKAPKQRRDAD